MDALKDMRQVLSGRLADYASVEIKLTCGSYMRVVIGPSRIVVTDAYPVVSSDKKCFILITRSVEACHC